MLFLRNGAETWRPTQDLKEKLTEEKMLVVTWKQEASIVDKGRGQKIEDIMAMMKNKKWASASHVMHRTENRWTTKVRVSN